MSVIQQILVIIIGCLRFIPTLLFWADSSCKRVFSYLYNRVPNVCTFILTWSACGMYGTRRVQQKKGQVEQKGITFYYFDKRANPEQRCAGQPRERLISRMASG